MKELSMDQLRESIAITGVDIFEAIEETIKVAACDLPNEFKIKRPEIAEELFSCKYSDGEVKDLCKYTFNGGMADVKENMVVADEGVEDSCLSEWEGLSCPPFDEYAFTWAMTTDPQIDLSTIFDGIDDDNDKKTENASRRQGKQLKLINKKHENVPKRQGKQLKLAYNVAELDSPDSNQDKVSACVEKKLYIPARSTTLKSRVARGQHDQPHVLNEKNTKDRSNVANIEGREYSSKSDSSKETSGCSTT